MFASKTNRRAKSINEHEISHDKLIWFIILDFVSSDPYNLLLERKMPDVLLKSIRHFPLSGAFHFGFVLKFSA